MPTTDSISTHAPAAEPPVRENQAQQKERHDSYHRRLKAAGLDSDAIPEDIDEFRWQFARRIAMFIDDWHGCPERLCQRNRGCMAPNNNCTNAEPLPPDWQEKDWPRLQAEVHKALKARLAECGELEDK